MTNDQVAPQATPEKQTEDSIPKSRSFLLCTISVMILLFPVYLVVYGLLFNP